MLYSSFKMLQFSPTSLKPHWISTSLKHIKYLKKWICQVHLAKESVAYHVLAHYTSWSNSSNNDMPIPAFAYVGMRPESWRVHALVAGIYSTSCVQYTSFINYGSIFFVDINQSFTSQPAPIFFPKMLANEMAAQWHASYVFWRNMGCSCEKEWSIREQHLYTMEVWKATRATEGH